MAAIRDDEDGHVIMTVNDDDCAEWVNNIEGLYRAMLASRHGMRAFVRSNRAGIDEVISAVLNAKPES